MVRGEVAALHQRIAALESALDSLQSQYGTRLAVLEKRLAVLDEAEPAEVSARLKACFPDGITVEVAA